MVDMISRQNSCDGNANASAAAAGGHKQQQPEDVPAELQLVTPDGLALNVLPDDVSQLDYARHVDRQSQEMCDSSVLVMDVGEVVRQFARWQTALPQVQPFYAVKCNDDLVLLRTLAALGTGFDCASKHEIAKVLQLGVSPDRIIYANPCKTRSFIADAHQRGVNVMTFDNVDELKKIKRVHPAAQLVLRIAVSDHSAQCELNIKFGCEPDERADVLLASAAQLGIPVIGISFHIGSGARDANAWLQGIAHARRLFDVGEACGHKMRLLDVGGGFIGQKDDPSLLLFEDAAATIRTALTDYFCDVPDVRVIAEPGRYFASTAFSLSCAVIARASVDAARITGQETDAGLPAYMYYMNDGVYGSFNCILYDHQKVHAAPLHRAAEGSEMSYAAVWGPTCDGLDCVLPKVRLPVLGEADSLYFANMGAYTTAAASTFNGMPPPQVHYYVSAKYMAQLWQGPMCALRPAEQHDTQLIAMQVSICAHHF